MNGAITYFELPSSDIEATEEFWGSLFGWSFNKGNLPGYSMIKDSNPMGGAAHGDPSRHPRIFFEVDDIKAAIAKIRELGGQADEPVKIPSGSFAHCKDSQGVAFSLSQSN